MTKRSGRWNSGSLTENRLKDMVRFHDGLEITLASTPGGWEGMTAGKDRHFFKNNFCGMEKLFILAVYIYPV